MSHENKGDRSARTPPPPQNTTPKGPPGPNRNENHWGKAMDAQNAAGGTQRITPATPQNPTPRTSPLDPHLSGQYRRWAAGRCCSLCLRNLCAAASLLSAGAAGSAMQPLAAPSRGGGEGGRGQMSQQPPPAWGGQMGWRGMGRGGGWRDRRMGREGGWRRPTCRSTARPSRPSHGLQTAAAALPADEAAGCPVPPRLWVSVGGPGGAHVPRKALQHFWSWSS